MQLPAVFTALLAFYCPWYTDPLPPITVLPGPEYEEVVSRLDPRLNTTLGLAVWHPTPDGPEGCRVYLREPPTVGIACHELRHCLKGHWHLDPHDRPG